MNAKFLIPVIAGMFFTLSTQAHDCSGGNEGGMDATGNQCNDATVVTNDASSSRPTSPMARPPKADASKAQSSNKSTAKRTVATRQTSARAQSKQG